MIVEDEENKSKKENDFLSLMMMITMVFWVPIFCVCCLYNQVPINSSNNKERKGELLR